MGSTPHAHAQANVTDPHDQGVVAMIGVFMDTFVVLTLNALVIISTLYTSDGILAIGAIPEGIGKANLAQTAFGIPSWIVGVVLVVICGFIFLGGVQRLAAVTEKVVPVMAAIFLLGGLVVLIARIQYLPATFAMIF